VRDDLEAMTTYDQEEIGCQPSRGRDKNEGEALAVHGWPLKGRDRTEGGRSGIWTREGDGVGSPRSAIDGEGWDQERGIDSEVIHGQPSRGRARPRHRW